MCVDFNAAGKRNPNSGRILCGLLLLACSLGCDPAFALKIKRAPKRAPIYGNSKRVKPAPPSRTTNTLNPSATSLKFAGVVLILPQEAAEKPSFRVLKTDGQSAEGAFGQWSPYLASDPEELRLVTQATSPTQSLLSTDQHQIVPLLPGSYRVFFSLPVPANPLEEFSGTMVWSVPVKVKKETLTDVPILIPAVPPEGVAHVRIKKAGPMTPFSVLSLEPVPSKGGAPPLESRWEYIPLEPIWPDEVRVALLPGRYRMILSAPGGGAYSSLRYEFPEPITVAGTGEIPIQRPKFMSLKATLVDRNGTPLMGTPLMLHGTGDTVIVTDSLQGSIDIRLPVDRYTVRALVFDDRGSREVTLDRKLDLSTDQSRSWKAPTTAIDFGFALPQNPSLPKEGNPESSP